MKKTLVSFVGTGKKTKKDAEKDAYERVRYHYQGKGFETALFIEALINFRKNDISECVLIGTHGSAWGALIEKLAYDHGKHVELFDELEQAFKAGAITEELLARLADVLSSQWSFKVKCEVHDSDITEDKVLPILYQYVQALEPYKIGNFLVDVTHAFRSMPLILMSSLPIIESVLGEVKLEIVYGELFSGNVCSLAPIWEAQKFNQALRHFNNNFDGDDLSELVKEEWESGSKAVKRLADTLQANFVSQLEECLCQCNNALKEFNKIVNPSTATKIVANALQNIVSKITEHNEFHKKIYALAELFKERRLWGQAITTLFLSLEAYFFYHYQENGYGDYDKTQELSKRFSNELKENGENRDKFYRLRDSRNAIAHGGALSKNKNGLPQTNNMPKQYQSYAIWLKKLYAE